MVDRNVTCIAFLNCYKINCIMMTTCELIIFFSQVSLDTSNDAAIAAALQDALTRDSHISPVCQQTGQVTMTNGRGRHQVKFIILESCVC